MPTDCGRLRSVAGPRCPLAGESVRMASVGARTAERRAQQSSNSGPAARHPVSHSACLCQPPVTIAPRDASNDRGDGRRDGRRSPSAAGRDGAGSRAWAGRDRPCRGPRRARRSGQPRGDGLGARGPGQRYAAAVADTPELAAANRRPIEQNEPRRHEADYAFDLKRKLEAAVEGDPKRLRAIARARRNKRSPRL